MEDVRRARKDEQRVAKSMQDKSRAKRKTCAKVVFEEKLQRARVGTEACLEIGASNENAKIVSEERFQRAEVGTEACLETDALAKLKIKTEYCRIKAQKSNEQTERKEAEKERREDAHDASFAEEQDAQDASLVVAISVLGYLDQKPEAIKELNNSLAGSAASSNDNSLKELYK